MNTFLSALKARRTCYRIGSGSPIDDSRISGLVKEAVSVTPSAFNMQSTRAVLLFGAEHEKLWKIVLESLRAIVPPDAFAATEGKIRSFAAGHGTVLYFDDTAVTDDYADRFSTYRDNYPVWAQRAHGMAQLNVWTLLEEAGLGASLQHYNPLIDEEVRRTWRLPESWKLVAQMPFGEPLAPPDPKESADPDALVKVFP